MIAVLGGADLIVFTGGIREKTTERCAARFAAGLIGPVLILEDERDGRSMPRCQVRVPCLAGRRADRSSYPGVCPGRPVRDNHGDISSVSGRSRTRVTSQRPRSSGLVLTSKPNSRHLFNLSPNSPREPGRLYAPTLSDFPSFDDHLHRGPPQSAAFQIRSQQDRILAAIAGRIGVNPDNAQDIATAGIKSNATNAIARA